MTAASIDVCVYDPDGRMQDVIDAIPTSDIHCRAVSSWTVLESAVQDCDCLVVPDHRETADADAVDALDIYDRVRTELLIDIPTVAYTTREGHRPLRRAIDHGLQDVIRVPPKREALLRERLRNAVSESPTFADPREQLHSLLRSHPETLFIKDRVGRFANITTRTAEKYGFSRAELVGMSDYELFDDAHASELWTEEQTIMNEEEPMLGKIEHYVDEGGNDQWVSTTKVPRYDDNGDVAGIVGGTKYVTTAKRQEKLIAELHEANQRLARAKTKQDIAEESVAIATGIEPFAHTEVALAEFGTDSLRPVAATDDTTDLWDDHAEAFKRVFETGEIEFLETEGDNDPETRVAIGNQQITIDPNNPADGQIIPLGEHGVFAFRLAEREPFDAFVDRLTRVFAANVDAVLDRAERERELDQKRRRIEEFATLGSHELRNKLQVVMARLGRVQAESGDPRLEASQRTLERMDRILQQLLRLARTGEAVPHARQPVDIETAARSAWKALDSGSASLQIESTATVQANTDAVISLFEFLLENAVEHAHETVTVRIGIKEGQKGFYVADDGPGIEAADSDSLFEVSYTDQAEDRGYGLYVTSAIVEAHDWTIAVSDSVDGGARFDITGI